MRHNLDQKSLAASVGVSRQWIVEIEKGKAGAPLGLVLRTLGAIGIVLDAQQETPPSPKDRKSTRLNSSHGYISYAVFCLKKKKNMNAALNHKGLECGSDRRHCPHPTQLYQ